MATSSSTSDAPLLRIPPEMRNAIYELVFSTEDGDVVTRQKASLTQTCRQIRAESHAMLYSTHYVLLGAGLPYRQWKAREDVVIRSVQQLQKSDLVQMKGFKIALAKYMPPMTLTRVTGSSISTLGLSSNSPGKFTKLQIQAAVIEPLLQFYEDQGFEIVMGDETLKCCANSCLCSQCQDHQVINERLKLFKIMKKSAVASQDTALPGRLEKLFMKLRRD